MGLGKTVQVIGLLLHRKSNRTDDEPTRAKPSLLVVPASLLANWKAELERFAPTISFLIAHPSGNTTGNRQVASSRSLHADDDCSEPVGPCEQHGLDADPHRSDEERESSQVGYRIRGIEPPDLARYPNSVKLLFWGWVVEYGLVAKDRELAKGLDKDGVPMQALDPQTIKHRKSEVGPTFKNAPPFEPPSARSRVRSLLKGRAHVNSAEFWWGFDSVTGASFAKILIRQRDDYGRDVFGLSPDGTAWVQANALKRWEEWKASPEAERLATLRPGIPAARQVRQPIRKVTVKQDLEDFDLFPGAKPLIEKAIAEGRFPGFRRLNARGEKWKPPHGSQPAVEKQDAQGLDLLITTYGMLSRTEWLREHDWDLVILDEMQAIKNSGTRQSRTVKELKSAARVVMTGTPVENRLSDLWSLFDFLNPGLLGGAKAFADFVKQMEARASYQPLRTLVGPYILRRLKTDKRVIADLPEKVEMSAFCTLSREQAALYEQAVRDLAEKLKVADGIQRRGLVLAQLMKLKQICNHPAQLVGTGDYAPEHSGKFQRLAEICEELGERQEKALIFTQFREITGPLAQLLEGVFGRPGLVLHGGTPVAQRRRLVESFQREDGPPFFVLSLKAGGTGLNLTAACHVIHFDRWWNPAVENQATDRTFRIGQTRNVLVHKFVCRGTVEERIDEMIAEKKSLSGDVIDGAETLLTEMSDKQLLDFVRLDVHKALDN